jgi:hypothetical protein
MAHSIRVESERMRPPMRVFMAELASVATLDPALIRGRYAVGRIGRVWEAAPAPGNLCARLRKWRRAGYPRAAGRAARRELKRLFSALRPSIIDRLAAAAERMEELGVTHEDAVRFGGGEDDTW